ncbi:MAG: hypothetical protein J5I52_09105 [Saprospiraceae bacterium]|nr:MAG: lipopolysaccharide biosynthesis protein [Bacteroidetes bacterium OLB9]MCO6464293.1 hypothetical protein [Saprospiraceae bacterium]
MSDTNVQPGNMQPYPPYQEEEITLKELIEKLIEYWKELWHKKWWIVSIAIPFIVFFGYKAIKTPVIYEAPLTYTLNDGSGGVGALSSILGSFGLGKGGKINLDKIVELSKSRHILHKVLFTTIPLDTFGGRQDFIANHLIKLHNLDTEWTNEQNDYTGFVFRSDSIDHFTTKELRALKMLYGKVVGGKNEKNPIFSNGYNEDTGILTITTSTRDEELSIAFSKLAYDELKNYYVNNVSKGNENTFEFVKMKTDSIFSLLRTKEFQLAHFDDSHRNLADPNLLTQRKLLETEILKLKAMYAEVTKNQELADFSLTAGMPDITVIDEPFPPLEGKGASLIIELIKGALIGGLLAVGFFIARKIILQAMQ